MKTDIQKSIADYYGVKELFHYSTTVFCYDKNHVGMYFRLMLTAKGVTLKLGAKAREQLLHEGYSQEYGAREMDRIIHNHLKTKLVREILFGSLKQGGECVINDLDELKS